MTTSSVRPIYFIINKVNGCIEESSGNKYLKLVNTDKSRDRLKKYEELLSKIIDIIKSITNNTNNFDEKSMKIKFNSKLKRQM